MNYSSRLEDVGYGLGSFLEGIEDPLISIIICLGVAFCIVRLLGNIERSLRLGIREERVYGEPEEEEPVKEDHYDKAYFKTYKPFSARPGALDVNLVFMVVMAILLSLLAMSLLT